MFANYDFVGSESLDNVLGFLEDAIIVCHVRSVAEMNEAIMALEGDKDALRREVAQIAFAIALYTRDGLRANAEAELYTELGAGVMAELYGFARETLANCGFELRATGVFEEWRKWIRWEIGAKSIEELLKLEIERIQGLVVEAALAGDPGTHLTDEELGFDDGLSNDEIPF